jgi:heptose I phosphotransferase
MLVLPKTWIERWQVDRSFEHLFSIEGTVYRDKDGRKTLRFSVDGRSYFAKFYRGIGWKGLIRNLIRFSLPVLTARKEWRAIRRLEQLGIKTMRAVGYGQRGANPARLLSFIITEELADTLSLEDLCRSWATVQPPPALKRALIIRVAEITRTLHENGINHRDLYICHFLLHVPSGVGELDPSSLDLFLIDLHRMSIRRRLPRRWMVKDLAALYFSSMDIGLTRRDVYRFVRVYCRQPLKKAVFEHERLWRQVGGRASNLYAKIHRRQPDPLW